jgi:hypothetical protein
MTQEEILDIWNSLNIEKVIFSFDCGGDSMNETSIQIICKNGEEIENNDISTYFDNEVYDNVEFYVNSDGYYLGEHGEVIITLSEDYDGTKDNPSIFCYGKQASEEFSEPRTVELTIKLSSSEQEYIKLNVSSIDGGWGKPEFNYKRDFLYDFKHKIIEENISDTILESIDNNIPDIEDGVYDDGYQYECKGEFKDSLLVVNCHYYFRVSK